MFELIAAAFGWFVLGWACRGWVLKRRLRKPPYSSTAIALQAEDAQRAIDTSARVKRAAEFYAKLIAPSLGVPWEEVHTPKPPIRFDEGHTQRGNGHGGPSTPKPPAQFTRMDQGRRFNHENLAPNSSEQRPRRIPPEAP